MVESFPEQFRSDGFNFRLLKRQGRVALLAKEKPQHSHPSFEVVHIQLHPAERVFGQDLPEREAMPPTESWGTLGWSYCALADAEARFNQLCKAHRKGHSLPKGFAATASQGLLGLLAAAPAHNAPTTP
jgi:hypothetical protein